MMKQLLTILTNRNFEEIDYFEAVFPLKLCYKQATSIVNNF